MGTTKVILAQDEAAFLKKAAQLVVEEAALAVREHDRFTWVLSGGSTPRNLFSLLSDSYYRDRIPWTKTHVFWGDERMVPPNHPDSNFKMAQDHLLSKVPIPAGNIHRVPAEMESPIEAARTYEQGLRLFFQRANGTNSNLNIITTSTGDIFPRFDLILLGLGEDGHTASLFPGSSLLIEKRKWVAGGVVEKLGVGRITLTFPVLNSAKNVLFLCAGEAKASIAKEILRDDLSDTRFPAQLVRPHKGNLTWLLDKGSAAQLPAALRYNALHV